MMKALSALLWLLLLAGCSAGSPEAGVKAISVADAFKSLVATGKYPDLDRTGTLLGIDTNKDGIRDDIARYLDTLNLDASERHAADKLAFAFHRILIVDLNDREARLGAAKLLGDGLDCLIFTKRSHRNKNLIVLDDQLEGYEFNTMKRTRVYLKFNQVLSGETFETDVSENACK